MNVQIIAALSADGFIAKDDSENSFSWNSKADKERFVTLSKAARVLVMGRKTFATIGKGLKDRHIVVYSRQLPTIEIPGVEYTACAPKALLEELKKRGYTDVAICGGGEIYNLFLKEGLVDRLYLTVEHCYLHSGIRLFRSDDYLPQFELEKLDDSRPATTFYDYVKKKE